jgi:hypothetical protein
MGLLTRQPGIALFRRAALDPVGDQEHLADSGEYGPQCVRWGLFHAIGNLRDAHISFSLAPIQFPQRGQAVGAGWRRPAAGTPRSMTALG